MHLLLVLLAVSLSACVVESADESLSDKNQDAGLQYDPFDGSSNDASDLDWDDGGSYRESGGRSNYGYGYQGNPCSDEDAARFLGYAANAPGQAVRAAAAACSHSAWHCQDPDGLSQSEWRRLSERERIDETLIGGECIDTIDVVTTRRVVSFEAGINQNIADGTDSRYEVDLDPPERLNRVRDYLTSNTASGLQINIGFRISGEQVNESKTGCMPISRTPLYRDANRLFGNVVNTITRTCFGINDRNGE